MKLIIISKIKPDALLFVTQLVERDHSCEVIILSDAVYMLTKKGECLNLIKKAINLGASFFALSEDVSKRGIKKAIQNALLINYSDLVDLLLEKKKSIINL